MNRRLIEERCRHLGIDLHELARQATVDPFVLVDPEGRRAEDAIPLSVLRAISRVLDIDLDTLVDTGPTAGPRFPDDDARIEAALEYAGPMCRDDMARLFGWTIGRVEQALAALESACARRAGIST